MVLEWTLGEHHGQQGPKHCFLSEMYDFNNKQAWSVNP